MYVVASVSTLEMVSFAYVVGTGFILGTYDPFMAITANIYQPSLSISGSNVIMSYYNAGDARLPLHVGTADQRGLRSRQLERELPLAYNTEFGVGGGDASPFPTLWAATA